MFLLIMLVLTPLLSRGDKASGDKNSVRFGREWQHRGQQPWLLGRLAPKSFLENVLDK